MLCPATTPALTPTLYASGGSGPLSIWLRISQIKVKHAAISSCVRSKKFVQWRCGMTSCMTGGHWRGITRGEGEGIGHPDAILGVTKNACGSSDHPRAGLTVGGAGVNAART